MRRSQIQKILPLLKQLLSASQMPGTFNPNETAFPLTCHRRGRISALGTPDVNAQLSNEAFEA
jgi:hypothetical protein